jgi:hypothetical protein
MVCVYVQLVVSFIDPGKPDAHGKTRFRRELTWVDEDGVKHHIKWEHCTDVEHWDRTHVPKWTKITRDHLLLNAWSKMRVHLATDWFDPRVIGGVDKDVQPEVAAMTRDENSTFPAMRSMYVGLLARRHH